MKLFYTYRIFYGMLCALLLFSCAKKGSIYGGPKDETPPKILRTTPENQSVQFSAKEIRLYFDELIEFQNPYEKVLISPPLVSKPEFSPLGYPSRSLKIRFQDSLQSNTTYSIHLGNAVVDSNEKNQMPAYTYSFSTGKVLDSLRFKGKVFYVNEAKNAEGVCVMMYPFEGKVQDSLAYRTFPKYVTTTKADGSFEFEYLRVGSYVIAALEDENKNYFFDPSKDQIAFSQRTITLPSKSPIALGLFTPKPDFKFNYMKQKSKNQFTVSYTGGTLDAKDISLSLLEDGQALNPIQKDETVNELLFTAPKSTANAIDSLAVIARYKKVRDTLVAKIQQDMKLDSLQLQLSTPEFYKGKEVLLSANLSVCNLEKSKIKIRNQDSIYQGFKHTLNPLKNTIVLHLDEKVKEGEKYQVQLAAGAVISCDKQLNTPVLFDVASPLESTLGKLKIVTQGFPLSMPLLVQLYKDQELQRTQTTTNASHLKFEYLKPGEYTLRVILDKNANGYWDTGNYLKRIQPETIYFLPKTLTVRANWEVTQQIDYQNPFSPKLD